MSSHCHLETVLVNLVLPRKEACVGYEHILPQRLELIYQAADRIEGGITYEVDVRTCWFGLAGNPPFYWLDTENCAERG